MRYQIPLFIFNNGFLPHGGDPSIRDPLWGISYGFTPITSYIISALFMKITSIFTTENSALLFSARLVTTICSTAMVGVCILIAQKLFKDRIVLKWLFLSLVSMLPQFVFISSYVNIDTFAMLSTAIIIYFWIRGIETDWSYKSCIGLAIGLAICLLSYYNAYGYVLCSIIFFFCTINKSDLLKKTSLVVLIVFMLSGWWFIRNAIIYDGDFLGLTTSNTYAELYADPKYKPSVLPSAINSGYSLWFMLENRMWLLLMARSFIGCFGNVSIPLFKWMYIFYALIICLGTIGCLIGIRGFLPGFKSLQNKKTSVFNLIMILAMLLPLFINIYYSYTSDFQPQGRYSMTALIPLMYFITSGLWIVFSKLIKSKKIINIVFTLICITVVVIAILCLTNIIIPTYY